MRRALRRTILSSGAVALAMVLWPASARGDYRDNFANGVIALERGDSQEAVRLLTAAVQENSKESTERVKLYGMRYKEYVPHFFLGIAYSKAGNCVGAIEELTESARQGIAQGLTKNASEWGTIKDNLAACIATVAKAPRPSARPSESASGQSPAPRPAETAVAAAVVQNPSPRPPVATPELVAQTAPKPSVAPAALPAPATRAPSPRATAPPPPPESLLAAASAYFRGDYARSASLLASARYPDPRAAAQARLFRAAAGYGLFVMGGAKDQALETQAARDVRECARLDPSLRVSRKAFSPRFVEFFEKNRA